MRRRAAIAVAAIVVLAAGAVVGVVLYRKQVGHDVRGSSTVEFVTTAPLVPANQRSKIAWPMFGYSATRVHATLGVRLRPPFRNAWNAGGNSLLEFPPVIGYGHLYFANASGVLIALSTSTGLRSWAYDSKRCAGASPAVGDFKHGTVYEPFLNRHPCGAKHPGDGEIVAVSVDDGDKNALNWIRSVVKGGRENY